MTHKNKKLKVAKKQKKIKKYYYKKYQKLKYILYEIKNNQKNFEKEEGIEIECKDKSEGSKKLEKIDNEFASCTIQIEECLGKNNISKYMSQPLTPDYNFIEKEEKFRTKRDIRSELVEMCNSEDDLNIRIIHLFSYINLMNEISTGNEESVFKKNNQFEFNNQIDNDEETMEQENKREEDYDEEFDDLFIIVHYIYITIKQISLNNEAYQKFISDLSLLLHYFILNNFINSSDYEVIEEKFQHFFQFLSSLFNYFNKRKIYLEKEETLARNYEFDENKDFKKNYEIHSQNEQINENDSDFQGISFDEIEENNSYSGNAKKSYEVFDDSVSNSSNKSNQIDQLDDDDLNLIDIISFLNDLFQLIIHSIAFHAKELTQSNIIYENFKVNETETFFSHLPDERKSEKMNYEILKNDNDYKAVRKFHVDIDDLLTKNDSNNLSENIIYQNKENVFPICNVKYEATNYELVDKEVDKKIDNEIINDLDNDLDNGEKIEIASGVDNKINDDLVFDTKIEISNHISKTDIRLENEIGNNLGCEILDENNNETEERQNIKEKLIIFSEIITNLQYIINILLDLSVEYDQSNLIDKHNQSNNAREIKLFEKISEKLFIILGKI